MHGFCNIFKGTEDLGIVYSCHILLYVLRLDPLCKDNLEQSGARKLHWKVRTGKF